MAVDLPRRLAAELLGAFLIFATVIGSGILGLPLSQGNGGVALIGLTGATVATLFVVITMLGPVSGAWFNPAVCIAFALKGALGWRDCALYIMAQLAAAILAVITVHAMFAQPLIQLPTGVRTGPGLWLGEVVATFGLLVTIIGTARHKPDALPLSVSLYVGAAIWFTSSTCFANPAITVARAMTDSFTGIRPIDVPAFIAAQIVGAVLGSVFGHWLFRPEPFPAQPSDPAS